MQINTSQPKRISRPQPFKAPTTETSADQVTLGGDRIGNRTKAGAIAGAVIGAAAGAYLASGFDATPLAVAGGIGGTVVGAGVGAVGAGSLVSANTSGGDGAVLSLGAGALGLVGGAIGGGLLALSLIHI